MQVSVIIKIEGTDVKRGESQMIKGMLEETTQTKNPQNKKKAQSI